MTQEPRVMKPTPGRQVWFYGYPVDTFNHYEGKRTPFKVDDQPLPATVVHVWDDRCVDLDIIDHKGAHWFTTSVRLRQPDDAKPSYSAWAEWTPYQITKGGT